jgi:hypothetical protein
MKSLLTDPVILLCSGIMIAGIVALIWAIGKFRGMKFSSQDGNPTDDFLSPAPDLRDLDFRAPTLSARPSASPAPAVGKDVADRLESMTQRLSEMQSVLMKQSSASSGPGQPGASAGGVGQGFSPETIDKLLKIIGNVIQQVDILQKSLNTPKDGAAAKADAVSPFTRL